MDSIRELRTKRGMTLEALAYLTGVTPATISRVERGVTTPKPATVVAMSRALGISIGQFHKLTTTDAGAPS